ncbi:hypothetical protein BCR42DRAFT_444157 [Absidia repens]|uniref:Heterokaryon incompatibility domain-containing protein n=1 Tax=Absidia repens TaxID=90262 RepID=A0A1X2HX74_9FUNG|nr:hypothetical protein BCR42DRAFT_444157 [Absidia repens]
MTNEGHVEQISKALSYRWGELNETTFDTHLGYLGILPRHFDLDDLYYLCLMMTNKPDLNDVHYVWVDAICVDQTNYEQTKSPRFIACPTFTKKVISILAVPDLSHTALVTHLRSQF